MTILKGGSPFLYDDTGNEVVGVKNPDNSESLFVDVKDLATPGTVPIAFKNSPAASVLRTEDAKLKENFSALDAGLAAASSDTLRTAMANADYQQPRSYGGASRINGTGATVSVNDQANFAGQGLGAAAPIGWVDHHYTDGIMHQWDNVGDGTILLLKNAFNPTRRPDKAADYVGAGVFISLNEHDFAAGFSKGLFFISKDAEFVWTGVKGVASSLQNKAEDSLFAFQQRTTNKHAFLWRFLNGGTQVFSFENDVAYTRAALRSNAAQTNGMFIEAGASDLILSTLDGTKSIRVLRPVRATTGDLVLGAVDAAKAVSLQNPLKIPNYSLIGDLPSAATFAACVVMYNGLMAYANAGVWKYVHDNSTVV